MRPKHKVSCFHIVGRSVVSSFYNLFSNIAPSVIWPSPATIGCMCSFSNPVLVHLSKSRLTAHLNCIVPRFSRLCNHLLDAIVSHSSLQGFKQAVNHHLVTPILTHDHYYPH